MQIFVVHIFKDTNIETKYQLPQHSMCKHGQSKSMCPLNLHPLFLFWNMGDPEKNQVQNMDLKKAGCKKQGLCYSKREKAAWQYFAPCFFQVHALDQIFKKFLA